MSTKNGRRRNLSRIVKRAVTALVALGVVLMIVMAWLPKPVEVELGQVVRGPLEVTVDEDGRARVKDRYVVSSPLAGSVARIELRAGDMVEQGQILARIVPLDSPLLDPRSKTASSARIAAAMAGRRQAHAQIDRARAALEFARAEAERERRLAERGTVAQARAERADLEARTLAADLASTEFAAKVADYELEMARAAQGRLEGGRKGDDQLEVPSPIGGRVLRVLQESEGAVQPGTPLIELGDPAALEIVVDVLTSDAVKIGPGAVAHIVRWGGGSLEGVVRRVEPSAFTRISALGVEEQRVNALIDLRSPRSEWLALGDGYRTEARIVTWRAESVLKVPASAVFRHHQGWAVFAVRGGKARLVPIRVGQRTGLEVQVLTGVSAGERVVTHPSDRVKDGVDVAGHG